MRILTILLLSLFCRTVQSADSLRIAVISDIHFLSAELAQPGKALEAYETGTGRNVADLHSVLDVVLDDIAQTNTDILLIAGDMTNHGEKESHLKFIEKIEPLREKGIRIFVVPGNHDINIPDAKRYSGDTSSPVAGISAVEFEKMYSPFGYGQAIRRDKESLSYLAALTDSLWLLCFDSNRYAEYTTHSISAGRILPSTMQWATDILREAQRKGITVMGMMHHGLVEHLPNQATIFASYLVEQWMQHAATLADNGLGVVFTGHFHANDITSFTSPDGNTIYDVETGSLAQYPFPYRLMVYSGGNLNIDTRFVESIDGTPNLQEKYKRKMEILSRRTAEARLKGMGLPIPDDIFSAMSDLMMQLSVLHAKGDETPDEELLKTIDNFAAFLGLESNSGGTIDIDFPPADNKLTIKLRKER